MQSNKELFQEYIQENPFLSLKDIIARMVEDEIVEHRFHPNECLNISSIAQDLGVSRTPVREALTVLTNNGMVRIEKNKGFFVNPFSQVDFNEYLELRIAIEVTAVRIVASTISNLELKELSRVKTRILTAFQQKNIGDINDVLEFHNLIVHFSKNQYLVSSFNELIPKFKLYRLYSLHNPKYYYMTAFYHECIYQAIKLKDRDLAESGIRELFKLLAITTEEAWKKAEEHEWMD